MSSCGPAALARALEDLGVRRPTIVFGAMRTKRVSAVLRELAPLDPHFVFTRVDDPGAHDPQTLAGTWRRLSGRGSRNAPSPGRALAMADDDPVVVAGSLYLVGAIRGMLTRTAEET